MRLSSILLVAGLIGAATNAQAEDRYGPAPAASRSEATPAYASGEALRWNGKTQAAPPTRVADLRGPQPLIDGALRNTSVSYRRLNIAPAAGAAPQVAPQAAPQAVAPRPAPPQQQQAMARPIAPPAAALAPAQAPQPAVIPLAGGPLAAQPAAQLVARPTVAQAAPQAQVQQATAPLPTSLFDGMPQPAEQTASTSAATRARIAANAANSGSGQTVASPRYYSVHSGYGMVADPIPLAQTGVGQ